MVLLSLIQATTTPPSLVPATFGELHAARSPQGLPCRTHLGRRYLLIRSLARIEESQERIAVGVNIQSVVLGRTITQMGDLDAVMFEHLQTSGIQPLEVNAVTNWRRGLGVGIEPTHIPSMIGQRLYLWLHLIGAIAFVRQGKIL